MYIATNQRSGKLIRDGPHVNEPVTKKYVPFTSTYQSQPETATEKSEPLASSHQALQETATEAFETLASTHQSLKPAVAKTLEPSPSTKEVPQETILMHHICRLL